MKKGKNQTNSEGILSALLSAITAVIVMLLVIYGANYVIRNRYLVVEVVGESMVHTLEDDDIVYCDSQAEIERGNIVIIDVSNQSEFSKIGTDIIIKRVIAIAGDSIKCENGVVYLAIGDGEYEPLEEPYIEGRNTVSFECTLAEGEIYVMGDNRENSMDSRRQGVGPLSAEDVLGVVPEWVLEQKAVIKGWESINDFLFGWMKR